MLLCSALTRFLACTMSMVCSLVWLLNLSPSYCKQTHNNPGLKKILFVYYHQECLIQKTPKSIILESVTNGMNVNIDNIVHKRKKNHFKKKGHIKNKQEEVWKISCLTFVGFRGFICFKTIRKFVFATWSWTMDLNISPINIKFSATSW